MTSTWSGSGESARFSGKTPSPNPSPARSRQWLFPWMALVALSCGPFLTVPAPVLAGTPESEVQDGSALLVLNWTPGRPAASSRGRGPNDPSRRAWRAACGSGGCRSAVVSGARGVRSSPGRVALGMPPSPPGLGFLICEVGVTVGPPPPDARGGDCDNGSRSKPGRVARLRPPPPSRPNACGLVAGDRPAAHRAAAAAFCPRTDQPEDGPACRASTPGRVSLRRLTAETPASKRPARQQA